MPFSRYAKIQVQKIGKPSLEARRSKGIIKITKRYIYLIKHVGLKH
jgi:hypothetical protein